MAYIGEIISLIVAASWTVTALFADKASHRLGSMTANVLRLSLSVPVLVAHDVPLFLCLKIRGPPCQSAAALILQKDQAFSIFLMVKVNLPAGTS